MDSSNEQPPSPFSPESQFESLPRDLQPVDVTTSDAPNSSEGTNQASPSQDALTYNCPECPFTSSISGEVLEHALTHGISIEQSLIPNSPSLRKTFPCEICGRELSNKANLRRHEKQHSGEMKHECATCKKRFFRKDQHDEHIVSHMKKYNTILECPVADCYEMFTQRPDLRKHLIDVHKPAWGNMIKCKKCNRTFARPERIITHFFGKHRQGEAATEDDSIISAIIQGQQLAGFNLSEGPSETASLHLDTSSSASEIQESGPSSPNDAPLTPELLQQVLSNFGNLQNLQSLLMAFPMAPEASTSSSVVPMGFPMFPTLQGVPMTVPWPTPLPMDLMADSRNSEGSTSEVVPSVVPVDSPMAPEASPVVPMTSGMIPMAPEASTMVPMTSQVPSVVPTLPMDPMKSSIAPEATTLTMVPPVASMALPMTPESSMLPGTPPVVPMTSGIPGMVPMAPEVSRMVPMTFQVPPVVPKTSSLDSEVSTSSETPPVVSTLPMDLMTPSMAPEASTWPVVPPVTPTTSDVPPVAPMNLNVEQLWSEEQTSSSASVNSMSPMEMASRSDIVGTCTNCEMEFRDEMLFLIHRSLHSDAGPFHCALCGHNCENRHMFMFHMMMQQHKTDN